MQGTPNLDAMLGDDWRAAVERRRADVSRRIAGRTAVVLFGAGYLGTHARRDLAMTPYEPVAFVDNNPALWGQEIDGLPVLDPDDAARRFGQDKLWLITVYTNSTVMAQCQRLGVPWVTCAELSWALPDPQPPTPYSAYPNDWPSPKNRSSRRPGCGPARIQPTSTSHKSGGGSCWTIRPCVLRDR